MTISRVFERLSRRLLLNAHVLTRSYSAARDAMLEEPTSRYVSSAYFNRWLSVWLGCRSEAGTTYEGGPMTDPWMMLTLINATRETTLCTMCSLVVWPRLLKYDVSQLKMLSGKSRPFIICISG